MPLETNLLYGRFSGVALQFNRRPAGGATVLVFDRDTANSSDNLTVQRGVAAADTGLFEGMWNPKAWQDWAAPFITVNGQPWVVGPALPTDFSLDAEYRVTFDFFGTAASFVTPVGVVAWGTREPLDIVVLPSVFLPEPNRSTNDLGCASSCDGTEPRAAQLLVVARQSPVPRNRRFPGSPLWVYGAEQTESSAGVQALEGSEAINQFTAATLEDGRTVVIGASPLNGSLVCCEQAAASGQFSAVTGDWRRARAITDENTCDPFGCVGAVRDSTGLLHVFVRDLEGHLVHFRQRSHASGFFDIDRVGAVGVRIHPLSPIIALRAFRAEILVVFHAMGGTVESVLFRNDGMGVVVPVTLPAPAVGLIVPGPLAAGVRHNGTPVVFAQASTGNIQFASMRQPHAFLPWSPLSHDVWEASSLAIGREGGGRLVVALHDGRGWVASLQETSPPTSSPPTFASLWNSASSEGPFPVVKERFAPAPLSLAVGVTSTGTLTAVTTGPALGRFLPPSRGVLGNGQPPPTPVLPPVYERGGRGLTEFVLPDFSSRVARKIPNESMPGTVNVSAPATVGPIASPPRSVDLSWTVDRPNDMAAGARQYSFLIAARSPVPVPLNLVPVQGMGGGTLSTPVTQTGTWSFQVFAINGAGVDSAEIDFVSVF